MRLFVGLGNPGKKYEKTRHNAGFFVIDKLLEKLDLKLDEEMCNAFYTIYRNSREKVIIAKPQTYMNLSGEAVLDLMKYFKLSYEDIVVVHDDLDLPVGKIRLRTSGSSAGQKGMGNIIDLLHTKDIKRIRVGIDKNPNIEIVDYVLGKVPKEDFALYEQSINKAADALQYYLKEKDFSKVMNVYNQWKRFGY